MSIWFELINQVLQLQATTIETCNGVVGGVGSEIGGCPTTAFNPVAAAFATQGYFMQADMLYYITGTTFGTWAPFLYLIAAAGGIISLAMGAPPKMYLWFFVGPGVYHWLVETRLPVHGVQWQVGNVPQDQRAVWRMAHVGIKNNNLVARMAGEVPGTSADPAFELKTNVAQPAGEQGWCKPTADPVYVSNFFLKFDMLTSYAVERLVGLTGVNRVSAVPDSGSLALPAGGADPNRWYLLADKKWALLDTITSARLNSSNLRDAFVTFLSSECGDALSSTIDQASFVLAANSTTGNTPCSVMLHEGYTANRAGQTCDGNSDDFYSDEYKLVWNALRTKAIPIPETLRRMFQDSQPGSFISYLNGGGAGTGEKLAGFYRSNDFAECHQTFYTVMQGFRWEASQVYSQLVRSGPIGLDSKYLLFNLFYGWGARSTIGGDLIPADQMEQWTRDLILVHLLRNELAIAPRLADKKFTNQATLDSYSQNFTANTGAKTKYGEVYSWARMVPYMQGVMLYLLAMGYPFACMMMVMPGWHKTLFTWMSFWLWVKLWDAGFAVVTTIERSIWSMLGNSTKLNYTSPLIYQMKEWGSSTVPTGGTAGSCPSFIGSYCFADMKLSLTCEASEAFVDGNGGGTPWWHTAAIFDRALTLASNIDIDVANGYYIYLMSALYFAVPAATGQLVLGAKAGVSGMVNGLVQGIQQDGGRGASSGFTGDMKNKGSQVAAAVGQSAVAKSHRSTGLAASAIQAGNQGLEAQLLGAQYGTASQNLGLQGQNRSLTAATAQAYSQAAGQVGNLVAARGANIGGLLTESLLGGSTNRPMTDPRSFNDALRGQDDAGSAPETGGANPQRETTGAGGETTGVNWRGAAQKGWGLGMQGSSGLYTLQSAMQGAANGAYQADLSSVMNNAQAGYNAANAQNNVASFGQTSLQQGLGMAGQRASQAAEFSAQSAAYQARVGLADSATGYTASMGVDSSHLGVGQKPTDMNGMAYSGMLGSGAKSAYGYASSGFMTARAGALSQLSLGASQVANEYQGSQYSLGQSMTAADNKFQDLNNSIGGDWLNIGSNMNRLPPNPTK